MIVAKAMAKDVSGRYSTAQDLGDDLRRFLAGRPVKARPAGAWEQVLRWGRRNPAVASLLTALVLVFLAGFAAVTVQWRRANAATNLANQTARAEAEARSRESSLRIQAQAQAAGQIFDHALELARRGDIDQGLLLMAQTIQQAPPSGLTSADWRGSTWPRGPIRCPLSGRSSNTAGRSWTASSAPMAEPY